MYTSLQYGCDAKCENRIVFFLETIFIFFFTNFPLILIVVGRKVCI